MRIALITFLILIVGPGTSSAASRAWTLRNGTELKAEFIGGVLENKIVLKAPGNRRHYFRLSEFQLADRDYIVNFFINRNDPGDRNQLLALMAFENTVQAIDPEAPPANSSNDNPGFNRPSPRVPPGGGPFNPLGRPNAAPQTPAAVPTEMYGIPLPSPELLFDDQVRSWTNLTGQKSLYRFDRALTPGHFRLKKADGTADEFAIVNFSKADIDYVKQLLAADMARPVFPEGNGFQSLTPQDVSRGYRVWTDRKNVPLIGKFVAIKGKNVVIEVNGVQEEYPKLGLSETDRNWIDNEIRQRSEQSQAASRQTMTNPGMSSFPRSRFSHFGSPGGHGENFAGNSSFGGHGDNSNNRFGHLPSAPVLEFHFQCPKCGHEWTEANTSISRCPQCTGANRINAAPAASQSSSYQQPAATPAPQPTVSSHSSFDSSPTADFAGTDLSSPGSRQGQGALMTIFYALLGVGVLAGLAAGLFRAFG